MYKENVTYNIASSQIHVAFEQKGNDRVITYDWHIHKEIEMSYLKTSSKEVYVGDNVYEIFPGDIIFLNGNVPHKTVTYNKAEFVLVTFSLDRKENDELFPFTSFLVNNTENGVALIKNGTKLNETIKKAMCEIETEFNEKELCFNKFIGIYVNQIVAYLQRERILSDTNEVISYKTSPVQRLIPVIKYINTHFSQQIQLDKLSNLININKAHLCRIFKNLTRSTLFEYINFVRVIHAEQLLINTDKLIIEICEECGFSSVSYFAKVFKEKNGITPKKYRRIKNEL